MSLPLFPLHTVLFPGCLLDLQIFETRYLDMVSRCLKAGQGFGVVLILDGQEVGEAARAFSPVGCEALIRDWQQRPNGLLGIRVEGGRRFRVLDSAVQADQLTLGEVEWLAEDERQPVEPVHADLLALLDALGRHPMVETLGLGGTVEVQDELANRLAYLLPFAPADKLRLLALDPPAARLELLQTLLERMQEER